MRRMRSFSLSARLGLLTVGTVLLVAGTLAPAALVLFERMAEENARNRVELAALGAAEAVRSEAAATATAAGLLAERPTLRRFAAAGNLVALGLFLDRYRTTGRLSGVALLQDGVVLAAAPTDLPWPALWGQAPIGAAILTQGVAEPRLLASGRAEVPGVAGAQVLVLKWLDSEVMDELSHQVGVKLRLLPTDPGDRLADVQDAYRSSAVVADRVVVQAELPRLEALRALAPLRHTFVLVTAVACLLAIGAGSVAGSRLTRPLTEMRRAAARIGDGDLATPVAPAAGAELSALSAAMEVMRLRLRFVTSELRHREAEAQALLSGIVEGVFAVDASRRIEYLNEQAALLLGVSATEAIGRFCGDVLHPFDAEGGRPCDERCPIVHARSRGSSRAVEHLALAAGRRTVVITSAPPGGSRQVQVLRDETEIEAARRSRDVVLANVSHELKTPLSAQLASIELLRDGLGDFVPADAALLVTSLERSTLRLVRLVDNLLESVRIETGQATLRRIPVDIEGVVDEAAALTRSLFDQRGQQLELAHLERLPAIVGDPGQLTQVLVNLLSNAQKYAPDGSKVEVDGAVEGDALLLWVEDAGPGVPPAMSSSIFDRFRRAGSEGQGMGLGLWIAKSIVERHGGQIAVSSSKGGGARFTLRFPIPEVAV